MFEEYRKGSTWRRIGILLGILVLVMLVLPFLPMMLDPFSEQAPPSAPGFVDISGSPRFRLFDRDDDGRIDCALKVPSLRWFRRGYARVGAERCGGKRVEAMPDEMAALADEALALRREHGLSIGRLFDVDGDGRTDCVVYDGSWLYVEGAPCPERRRKDAEPLTSAQRTAADRLLVVEHDIRERWLDPPTLD